MSGQFSSSLHLVVLLVCRRNRSQLENEKIRVLLPSLTPARSARCVPEHSIRRGLIFRVNN